MADLSDRKSDRLVLVKTGRDFDGITLGFWGLIASKLYKIYACVLNRGKPINKKIKASTMWAPTSCEKGYNSIYGGFNISYPFVRPLVGVESPNL